MASGTPVVAGRAGSLPEITSNAAVLVDPLSIESIASGIAQAIEDRELLVARGREHARTFSWTKAAAETAAVYRELR
jgi:glycosyltransferase involved in cell wall biosynthesis